MLCRSANNTKRRVCVQRVRCELHYARKICTTYFVVYSRSCGIANRVVYSLRFNSSHMCIAFRRRTVKAYRRIRRRKRFTLASYGFSHSYFFSSRNRKFFFLRHIPERLWWNDTRVRKAQHSLDLLFLQKLSFLLLMFSSVI